MVYIFSKRLPSILSPIPGTNRTIKTADSLEIHRLSDPIYYLDLDYSRHNDVDELLYEGNSIYLYGKDTGSWKIFFQWTGTESNLS